MTHVVVCATKDAVIERVATDTIATLVAVLAVQTEAHVVLTGGTVGIGLLNALGALEAAAVDWSRVHLWWGDERWVAAASADRNDRQAFSGFISRLPFSPGHVHRMPSRDEDVDIDTAANDYSGELTRVFGSGPPRFDLTFLGVGPDSHVASLFPHHADAVHDDGRLVVPVRHSPKPPPERLSLTLRSINASQRIWMVTAGADKATAVAKAQGPEDFVDAPVSAVSGRIDTRLYCDQAAAAL